MIESVKEIQSLFKEIDDFLKDFPETEKIEIYVIGGTVLLEQGLKPATKDIDLVVLKVHDFTLFENTLKTLAFRIQNQLLNTSVSISARFLKEKTLELTFSRKLFAGSFR